MYQHDSTLKHSEGKDNDKLLYRKLTIDVE